MEPLRQAAAAEEPAYNPPRDIDALLDAKQNEIETNLADLRKSRSLFAALIASVSEPAQVTLAAAMAALVKEQELERAKLIAQETLETRKKMDALEAEKAKRKLEQDLALAAEAAQSSAEEQANQLEHERLVREAKSPAVRKSLVYFFTSDYLQPINIGGLHFGRMTQTAESQPISLSSLERIGALNPSTEGLQSLHALVINRDDKTRPTWGVPPQFSALATTDMARLKKAQDYLIRLGPTLVEQGLLSK